MHRMLMLGLGLSARAASLICGLMGDWILTKLAEGTLIGFEIVEDARELGQWLVGALAHYVSGAQVESSYY